jgi:hypothetical protein
MEDFGIFYGHLICLDGIWCISWPFGICILWLFGIFFPVLVCCTNKNLATLFCSVLDNDLTLALVSSP